MGRECGGGRAPIQRQLTPADRFTYALAMEHSAAFRFSTASATARQLWWRWSSSSAGGCSWRWR